MSLTKKEIITIIEWNHNRCPRVFVETGTFLGNTILNIHQLFDKIYTVEASEKSYNLSKKNCNKIPHAHFYHADSAKWLPEIIKKNNEPALFFLDAHFFLYPKQQHLISRKNKMPLMEELKTIKSRKYNDLVVIDDYKWLGRAGAGVNWQHCSGEDILKLMQPTRHIVWKDYLIFPTISVSLL